MNEWVGTYLLLMIHLTTSYEMIYIASSMSIFVEKSRIASSRYIRMAVLNFENYTICSNLFDP